MMSHFLKQFRRQCRAVGSLLAALAILVSCSGDEQKREPSSIDTNTPQSEPVEDLNQVTGIWSLNKGLNISAFSVTREVVDGQQEVSITSRAIATNSTFMRINPDGNIDLLFYVSNELDDQLPCIFTQRAFEQWTKLEGNRYKVRGNTMRDIRLRLTEDSILIEQEDFIERFPRATEIDLLRDCEDVELRLSLTLDLATEISDLSEIQGLWQKSNVISLSEDTNATAIGIADYLHIAENQKDTTWRLTSSGCLSLRRNLDEPTIKQGSAGFTRVYNDGFEQNIRIFAVSISAGNSMDGNGRYIIITDPDGKSSPQQLSGSTLSLADRHSRCEVIRSDLEELNATRIYSLDDLVGVWQLPGTNPLDERYLSISDTYRITILNYRGDAFDLGENCYEQMRQSELIKLENNTFIARENGNDDPEIEMYLTDGDELIMLSDRKSNGEFNIELPRAGMLEASDLRPLCPRVRD